MLCGIVKRHDLKVGLPGKKSADDAACGSGPDHRPFGTVGKKKDGLQQDYPLAYPPPCVVS